MRLIKNMFEDKDPHDKQDTKEVLEATIEGLGFITESPHVPKDMVAQLDQLRSDKRSLEDEIGGEGETTGVGSQVSREALEDALKEYAVLNDLEGAEEAAEDLMGDTSRIKKDVLPLYEMYHNSSDIPMTTKMAENLEDKMKETEF